MIKEFAEYFSLTIWDWFTALVAVTSLVVAVSAYVIAIKTYHVSKKTLASQKQTEINTTPVINLNIQEILFNEMIVNLYWERMEIKAIWNLLKSRNYNSYLAGSVWDMYIIDLNSIHYELFYNDSEKFRIIEELRKRAKTYNAAILSLKESTKSEVNHDVIDAMFRNVLRLISIFPHLFWQIQTSVYNIEKSFIIPLNDMYKYASNEENPDYLDKTPINFDEDDTYLVYMGKIPCPKKKVLLQTDEQVESDMKRLTPFLIEHRK